MKKLIMLSFIALLLQGCASKYEKPVGVGKGRDDLKQSPCACLEFYDYNRGGFYEQTKKVV